VDLSAWAPPVGDQGQVGSCGSWATGYYYRYWLRNHATGETATFAPMYLYSQIADGNAMAGSSYSNNFAIMESQGIDHEVDYPQGDYDYTDQPTSQRSRLLRRYKITSYTNLFFGTNSGNQAAVEPQIAAGYQCFSVSPCMTISTTTSPVPRRRTVKGHEGLGKTTRLRAESTTPRRVDRELVGDQLGTEGGRAFLGFVETMPTRPGI